MDSSTRFDAVTNTTMKQHQGSQPLTMRYDAAQRILTAMDGPTPVTYTFDNNGNMTLENRNGAQTQSVYDRSNRLKAAVTNLGDSRTTMLYDGDGLRRVKQLTNHGLVVTTYVWDGSDYLGEVH